MSVLIKGMEMPTSCMDCPFKGFDRVKGRGNICTINDSITLHAVLDGVDIKFVRMGDCPLVPVPPHGDLIDRNELYEKTAEWEAQALHMCEVTMNDENPSEWRRWSAVLTERSAFKYDVANAPTIIPAEEGE